MVLASVFFFVFFFSSRRRHTSYWRDWSSDVCSSDLGARRGAELVRVRGEDARVRLAEGERESVEESARAVPDILVAPRVEGGPKEIGERRVGKECRSRWSPDQ